MPEADLVSVSSLVSLPVASSEQVVALNVWNAGGNQVCVATAGAGKSTLLLHACALSAEPVLIVTYNKALQSEMDAKLQRPHACFTFHGLASAYFSVAPDDAALHAIVDSGAPLKRPLCFSRVCVDEAQDLKEVYVALLRSMVDVEAVQWLIVGDPTQLLNDFDADDPACISFMENPSDYFGKLRAWTRTRLGTSRRLTAPIVRIANAMLDPSIPRVTAGGACDPVPVHICTVDPYGCADLVVNWIVAVRRRVSGATVMVLVARRRGNGAVSTLVNTLSRRGIGVYVHGHDCEASAHPSKVTIVSWHSAKGLQCDASVVMGVEDRSAHNPLHVALTRSRQHMLVVNCIRRPNRRLIGWLSGGVGADADADVGEIVRMDEATRGLVTGGLPPVSDVAAAAPASAAVRDLSGWNMIGRGRVANELIVSPSPPVTLYAPACVAGEESISAITIVDTSRLYLRAVLMQHEYTETGKCRLLDFVAHPASTCRVDRSSFFVNPNHAYLLPSGERESNLLPQYAYELLHRILGSRRVRSVVDWMNLAVMVDGFCGYHHTMGPMVPCDGWAEEGVFLHASQCLVAHMACMDKPVTYDTRWCRVVDGTTFHRRCFATTPSAVVSVMYGESVGAGDRARACLVAALHPSVTRAVLLNLKTGGQYVYEIGDKAALVNSLVSN